MPNITITVIDKQRGPRSEKTGKYGPWKIAAASGLTYKAWDDIASELYIGKPYDCRAEVVTRGEFTDTFIKHAVEAKVAPGSILVSSHPGEAMIAPPRNGAERGMMVKESFLQLMRNHAGPITPALIADAWTVAEEIYERVKDPQPEQADFPTEETF